MYDNNILKISKTNMYRSKKISITPRKKMSTILLPTQIPVAIPLRRANSLGPSDNIIDFDNIIPKQLEGK